MKRLTFLFAVALVLVGGLSAARAANYYFDVNGTASDSGVTGSVYDWTSDGTGALPGMWNTTNADGAGPGPTVTWTNGNDAIFSAGEDANGQLYGVKIAAGVTATSATIENGIVQISTGVFDTGAGDLTVKPNAGVRTIIGAQFNGAGRLVLQGTTAADAAVLQAANPGSAGTMISNLKTIDIQGFGRFTYDNADSINDNVVSILNGSIITGGAGATPTNGGAGTLVKSGPDQIGYAPRDIGGGVGSWTLNSFAKVLVEQGTFRIRNGTINGVAGVTDERQYGAVPLAPLADAIKLDGGGTGTSTSITLHVNRGITIGPNGGFMDNGAGASITVPGPLTAAPGSVLTIGSPTSTSAANPAFEFSNAGNSTTFQGDIFMIKSTMRVKSDMTARHFSGTGNSATVFGFLEIGGGNTFTAGTDNQDASFDGRVLNYTGTGGGGTGGIFKWDGTGTLTMNTGTAGEWSNTGGVNINKGSIKFATSAAGFGTTTPVTIGSTAKLNMNGINDNFGSLTGPAGAVVDMNDAGAAATPGNLTLAATTGSTTYSGTIIGGGNFTKAGTASTATQILGGNTTLGTVTVTAGSLINNAAMTTTGGVSVAAAGSLGGTGSIAGAVSNTGVIAPGNGGIGTLSVTGNVTENAAATWHNELSGTTTDKLAVTGNIDLSAAGDFLSVTGVGTGTSWIIGSYTGTLTGIFDNITAGYSVNYGTGTNSVITLNAAAGCAPGDFNCDTHVDAGDYVSIRKQFSDLTTGGGLAAYTAWRTNFGVPAGAGSGGGLSSAAVPEPASFGLLLVGLAAFGLGRRGRVA